MSFRWLFHGALQESAGGSTLSHACVCKPEDRQGVFPLSEVEPGVTVEICCLDGEGPMIRRLSEMGFIPGTEVAVLRRAPLSDPIEFHIRGYLVSLRIEEARRIRVRSFIANRSVQDSDLTLVTAN